MTTCAILAPGPSMTEEIAKNVQADYVIVINNVFELVPRADVLAANDRAWWAANPEALGFDAKRRVSCNRIDGVEKIAGASTWNSGVLALETAFLAGHTDIELYGFDMGTGHYFGKYTNGLGNTSLERRAVHQQQFFAWRATHSRIRVNNRTPGSLLKAYPYVE